MECKKRRCACDQHTYREVIETLQSLTDATENIATRGEAGIVLASITTFPFLCYLRLWGKILPEVNHAQKFLQSKGLGLDQAVITIRALYHFLDENREPLLNDSLNEATLLCEEMEIPMVRHVRRKRRMDGEEARDVGLSLQGEIRREIIEVIDRLKNEIDKRFLQLNIVNKRFGFLRLDILMNPEREFFINEKIDALMDVYNDFDGEDLKKEIERCRYLIRSSIEDGNDVAKDEFAKLT